MKERTRASLFLMEQLIVITVFAVCASVCAWIFAEAFFVSKDANDLNYALIAAKNGAETFKAYGTAKETAEALGGVYGSDGSAVVYYDKNWRVSTESEAAYVLRLIGAEDTTFSFLYELSVETVTGEEIIAFTVAA